MIKIIVIPTTPVRRNNELKIEAVNPLPNGSYNPTLSEEGVPVSRISVIPWTIVIAVRGKNRRDIELLSFFLDRPSAGFLEVSSPITN